MRRLSRDFMVIWDSISGPSGLIRLLGLIRVLGSQSASAGPIRVLETLHKTQPHWLMKLSTIIHSPPAADKGREWDISPRCVDLGSTQGGSELCA